MKRLNSNWYTEGKFGKGLREILDTDNPYLYSKGRYATKITKDDLPEEYVRIFSRSLWYMYGWINTKGVVDVHFTYCKENHILKDDYLYVSYTKPIVERRDKYSFRVYEGSEIDISGGGIIPLLLAIEKNSPDVDTSKVRKLIDEKVKWFYENCPEEKAYLERSYKTLDVYEMFK